MELDPHYSKSRLAALYDQDSPWGEDTDFYIAFAGSDVLTIIDAGCGTGTLACGLSAAGHNVIGVDPAAAMLEIARGKPLGHLIDWQLATAAEFKLDVAADLIVMTGHAFQVLLSNEDISAALENFFAHLNRGGRLVFESRNPYLNWDQIWGTENVWSTEQGDVRQVRSGFHREGEYVSFRHTFEFEDESLISDSELRFAPKETIARLLEDAGFEVSALYGDWRGKPFGDDDKEMIFVATKP